MSFIFFSPKTYPGQTHNFHRICLHLQISKNPFSSFPTLLFPSSKGNRTTSMEHLETAIKVAQKARNLRFDDARRRLNKLAQSTEERSQILQLSLFELREALHRGEFSARAVHAAYSWKALEVHGRLNCLAEFLVESFDDAKSLDKNYADPAMKKKRKKLPLFGIPFTIEGYDASIGLPTLLGKPATETSSIVKHLRSLGAVLFATTNVSMGLTSMICSNPVYGPVLHPLDPNRSPGGSSGGCAALVASGGTPFSIGNDCGGSVRIPAAFCGLSSLKPARDRFFERNVHNGWPGAPRTGLSSGFLTRTVKDLILLNSMTLGDVNYHEQLEPYCPPLPLDVKKIHSLLTCGTKFRIGFYTDNGYVKATPTVARAVETTVERLRSAGHTLVPVDFCENMKFVELLCRSSGYIGVVKKIVRENPPDPHLPCFTSFGNKNNDEKEDGQAEIVEEMQHRAVMRNFVEDTEELRLARVELDEFLKKFLERWIELKLDAIVCPVIPHPANEYRTPEVEHNLMASCYTIFYNLLDFPAGSVPAGCVKTEDIKAIQNEKLWPTEDNSFYKFLRDIAPGTEGLPVGVQVVTLPYQEEKCLALMRIIEKLLEDEK